MTWVTPPLFPSRQPRRIITSLVVRATGVGRGSTSSLAARPYCRLHHSHDRLASLRIAELLSALPIFFRK